MFRYSWIHKLRPKPGVNSCASSFFSQISSFVQGITQIQNSLYELSHIKVHYLATQYILSGVICSWFLSKYRLIFVMISLSRNIFNWYWPTFTHTSLLGPAYDFLGTLCVRCNAPMHISDESVLIMHYWSTVTILGNHHIYLPANSTSVILLSTVHILDQQNLL